TMGGATGRPARGRLRCGLRGDLDIWCRCTEENASRDRRQAQQRDQRRARRFEAEDTADRARGHAAWGLAGRIWQAHCRRYREVGQGDPGGQYQSGLTAIRSCQCSKIHSANASRGALWVRTGHSGDNCCMTALAPKAEVDPRSWYVAKVPKRTFSLSERRPGCQREFSIVVLPDNYGRAPLAERAGAAPTEGGLAQSPAAMRVKAMSLTSGSNGTATLAI